MRYRFRSAALDPGRTHGHSILLNGLLSKQYGKQHDALTGLLLSSHLPCAVRTSVACLPHKPARRHLSSMPQLLHARATHILMK